MEDLRLKAQQLEELSKDYETHRMACAKNRLSFRLILASKMQDLKSARSNAGIEALELLLLAEGDKEVIEYYRKWHFHENKYKALERIMEAIKESLHLEKFLGRVV